MAYPQNVAWLQLAFATLERFKKDGETFTSLKFKGALRQVAKGQKVFQNDVGEFLRQAYADGHMEGFEMEDNGIHRIYRPKAAEAKPSLWQKIKSSINQGLDKLLGTAPTQD